MNPEEFMREAIRLANEGMRAGLGGPFGSVVVCRGEIAGRGSNRVVSSKDPTAHAEINAIRDACVRLGTFQLPDCELFTTCEPCPMCLGAIYWARIRLVYFANTRLDAAEIGFDDDFIYRQVSLPVEQRDLPMKPLLREEALATFREWKTKPDKKFY